MCRCAANRNGPRGGSPRKEEKVIGDIFLKRKSIRKAQAKIYERWRQGGLYKKFLTETRQYFVGIGENIGYRGLDLENYVSKLLANLSGADFNEWKKQRDKK